MTDARFDDPELEVMIRSSPDGRTARAFAEHIAPEHWTAATLLAGLDRRFVSRAEIVRLLADHLVTGEVEEDSWQERLALLLPDEFDEVRPVLVGAAAHSRERARHSDVRPWAFLALDDLRQRWQFLSNPYEDIDDVLFVLGEPPRYDVLRPWAPVVKVRNGLHATLLATLDVVIAEDAQAYGTAAVRDAANTRARASERLAFLPGKGLRLVGATRTGSVLLMSVTSVFLVTFSVSWLMYEPDVPLWQGWPVLSAFALWLVALLRLPFVGVFVNSSHLRVASFVATRRIPLVDIRSIGSIAYSGMWWPGRDPLVSMLTVELRNGATRDLPVTMASNRRAARLARRLAAVSGISLHKRETT
jgi:hypothetical protein